MENQQPAELSAPNNASDPASVTAVQKPDRISRANSKVKSLTSDEKGPQRVSFADPVSDGGENVRRNNVAEHIQPSRKMDSRTEAAIPTSYTVTSAGMPNAQFYSERNCYSPGIQM